MRWSYPIRIFSTFIFSLNGKDRFADIGKIAPESRFVLRWNNSPQFAQNPHTLIFRFTLKTIKNEQTTTNKILTIRERPPCRWSTCRSFQRKKT